MRPKHIFIGCLLISLLLVIARNGFAQERKDTLFFNNGEVLIGEFKSLVRGMISFDSDAISIISIKAYKIKAIHTTLGILRIETTTKQWLYGSLVPSGIKDTIYIVNEGQRIKLARSEISTITPLRHRFFDQLDGKVSAGLSYSHSSGIGQFNLSADITHKIDWLQSELTVSELGSIDSSHFSRDQENAQIASYHYLGNSTWLAGVLLSYQRNQELSLAHRYQVVFASGNKFVSEANIEVLGLTGISTNVEKSIGGKASDGVLTEIPLVLTVNYFKYKHPNMQISMSNAGYISLTQSGRYRYDGSINFSWELVSDFYFTTNLYANYDSKPADVGAGKIDYGVVMGISYKF